MVKQNNNIPAPDKTRPVPEHIAIIMDGNGRWAKKRGMPRSYGHKRGAKVFEEIAEYCDSIGVKYLTVYAFSTENWARPKEEVDALMKLFRDYLLSSNERSETISVRFIGDLTVLDEDMQQLIAKREAETRGRTGLTTVIAINYGGRDEILHAARELARKAADGLLDPEKIDRNAFESELYTAGIPDPDLILRPSGEKRLSNFLLWQASYSEFVYMDTLWPDFTPELLEQAIAEFNRRNRRYGGI